MGLQEGYAFCFYFKSLKKASFDYKYNSLSSICFCDNATYGRFGAALKCQMNCAGNVNQKCGDTNRNSVYRTSLGIKEKNEF